MFIGEYYHNLDDKGRLALPVKFRVKFKGGLVITRGLDNCLFVYTRQDWQILAEKLSKLPINQAKTRAFARLLLAGAMDVAMDGQGRINVPDYLLNFGLLKKQVVITGLYNRLEIWDEKQWQEYKQRTEKDSGEIAEALGELGV
ncbi:MAG: cell division/cell wall cluster transcriptional repressor MraZ [Candidatus Komeilibacteria bacterium CG_4_10_14_0_2_um_filter_37_10]|uniref:Transcriptional regulator MraZ n=1 Tax=Candidatus Komeilibacteria bacterium CG_4_10_14_0_2_um_filter_37_10 TaxID=1974470 RepID=A0A2M7VEH9_9BACT|nr:MAG: cell division/cell wall cluster transcriptional repressor MraZ [Candidatus Komeilibacteria bacterium CG_4_10_14_0_2_um_filter_37_10]